MKCQECRRIWQVDWAQVGREAQVIYRGDKTVKVRLQCPTCHKYVVVDAPQEYGR